MFLQNMDSIGQAVSEKKIFKENFGKKLRKFIKNRNIADSALFEQTWEGTTQGRSLSDIKSIGPAVLEKKIFKDNFHEISQKNKEKFRKNRKIAESAQFEQTWEGASKEMSLQNMKLIRHAVSEKKIFKDNFGEKLRKFIKNRKIAESALFEQTWEGTTQGRSLSDIKSIGPAVLEKKIFKVNFHEISKKKTKKNSGKIEKVLDQHNLNKL